MILNFRFIILLQQAMYNLEDADFVDEEEEEAEEPTTDALGSFSAPVKRKPCAQTNENWKRQKMATPEEGSGSESDGTKASDIDGVTILKKPASILKRPASQLSAIALQKKNDADAAAAKVFAPHV